MYTLNADTQELAIRLLSEGNSIRSTERITGAHRDTIMRLMVRVTLERVSRKTDRAIQRTARRRAR